MSYEVSIVADSVALHGGRITTFRLKYPRMIHAEFLTHRAISRNASSTRAIPIHKMIRWVKDDPAVPIYWGSNKAGMQAGDEVRGEDLRQAIGSWEWARDRAISAAQGLMAAGVHKQIASRVLEPFAHINVVATATAGGWTNFFALRCHADAMPEMRHLAVMMARAYRDGTPAPFEWDWWHLPFLDETDLADLCRRRGTEMEKSAVDLYRRVSVARCARVSYLTHEGKATTIDDDLALADRLEASGHWSPFEHQATPARWSASRCGNFLGWAQYRQQLALSVHRTFDFATLDQWA
jgi:thymidylate synthase ThyX